MADLRIVVQKMKRSGDGITPTYQGSLSASNTHQVNNNGKVFLHFKKSAAVNAVVTVITPPSLDGNAVADLTVTVPANTGDKMFGPFDPSVYNVLGGHDLEWTVSDVDGLTMAAVLMEG